LLGFVIIASAMKWWKLAEVCGVWPMNRQRRLEACTCGSCAKSFALVQARNTREIAMHDLMNQIRSGLDHPFFFADFDPQEFPCRVWARYYTSLHQWCRNCLVGMAAGWQVLTKYLWGHGLFCIHDSHWFLFGIQEKQNIYIYGCDGWHLFHDFFKIYLMLETSCWKSENKYIYLHNSL
jgi:hypothetical protein